MPLTNFQRMIQLAEEVFATRNDPNQLDVDEEVLERLIQLHPSSVSEFDDGNGPVAWVLVIPTTTNLMKQFVSCKITEQELLDFTPPDSTFDALYLCSAMVLEEYRGKGIASRLTLEAIEDIRKDHPLQSLFVWPFTKEGKALSEKIARISVLPLEKRQELS